MPDSSSISPASRFAGKSCTDAACGALLAEYVQAVDLISGVREATRQPGIDKVRYFSLPTSQVGADFFCSAEHPKLGWCCLLADAAGHGLPAAIFALHTPMLFRECVLLGMSLPAIHDRLHQFLLRQQVSDHFVCGILVRVHGREIEVINAGMPDALLFTADGRLCEAFPSQHLPIGIDAGAAAGKPGPAPQRYRLAREETAALLLYSDGLSELGVLNGDAFGRDGVLASASMGAVHVFDRLVARVNASAGAVHDDTSIALIPVPLDERLTERVEAAEDVMAVLSKNVEVAAMLRIVENFDRGLVLTDAEQRILYVNPAFSTITGYTLEEAVGQTPRMLNSGRHDAGFYRGMWQALRDAGAWRGEIWNRRKDGTLYLEWLDIRALHSETGTVENYLATFTVIEQQQYQQERLRFLALHDPLTGLANRILLTDRGGQAIRRADRSERSLAVLFIDLDRFKSINDSLGHDIGDEVLVSVTQRLSAMLREDDTLSRFGGDEFVCLLPDIADRHDAGMVANKLLAALDKPIDIAGHHFKVGASIGISAYPSDGHSFDDLVVQADRAMLRAKQAGGNMVKFFSAEMAVAVERQLEMEARLDAAIKAGQLELHYQPKLDLLTRSVIGAEALVRWRDPQEGLIPPGVFIPVAERSDLIAKIGHWVLTETCRMLSRHQASLPADFHIAVNVSPLQFERCDLPGVVARIVGESGIPPRYLQLEVTESLIIRDADGAAEMLQRIVESGVSVVLDDFGTGYSNLASLSKLPLAAFKLDQSFVRCVDTDAAKASIAKSVWHLADGLGKKVVAEGIETCGECIKLMAMGYRIGQGYRFGKPMPEAEFFTFLDHWHPQSCKCPPAAQPLLKVE
jgi:diguanylate cyclase (GGDEF)-like protein/PAS domain S-box-containing protein